MCQKAGISTVWNIISYAKTKKFLPKSKIRKLYPEIVIDPICNSTDYLNQTNFNIKVAIVRDPIDRIKSVYADRILKKNRENYKELYPTFGDFTKHFVEIMSTKNDIYYHACPQYLQLGDNINVFDKVYNTTQINEEFKKSIEKLYNIKIPSAVHNSSGLSNFEITKSQKDFYYEYYKKDFEIFGDFLIL